MISLVAVVPTTYDCQDVHMFSCIIHNCRDLSWLSTSQISNTNIFRRSPHTVGHKLAGIFILANFHLHSFNGTIYNFTNFANFQAALVFCLKICRRNCEAKIGLKEYIKQQQKLPFVCFYLTTTGSFISKPTVHLLASPNLSWASTFVQKNKHRPRPASCIHYGQNSMHCTPVKKPPMM